MSLVEVLNRHPARRERFRDWIGLISATLSLAGMSFIAWRGMTAHGTLLAFGISAGLLAFSWLASLVKWLLSRDIQIRPVREHLLLRPLEWLKRVRGFLTPLLQKRVPEEQPTSLPVC